MTVRRRKKANCVEEEQAPYGIGLNGHASHPFRFIDLFCGIGGFRIAFEKTGGQCVFSSDWDKFSQITYAANFGEKPRSDIHAVAVADIPPHDILCAGFPCQPFSLAGVSKKNSLGRKHGFDDEKQGNLFFSIADILDLPRLPMPGKENSLTVETPSRDARPEILSPAARHRPATAMARQRTPQNYRLLRAAAARF